MSSYHGLADEITADNCHHFFCTCLELISLVNLSKVFFYIYYYCLRLDENYSLSKHTKKILSSSSKLGKEEQKSTSVLSCALYKAFLNLFNQGTQFTVRNIPARTKKNISFRVADLTHSRSGNRR